MVRTSFRFRVMPYRKGRKCWWLMILLPQVSKGAVLLEVVQLPRLKLTYFKGGSAEAAGNLVKQLGGDLIGYLFILELDFLKGRDKLDAPVITLLKDDTMGK